MTGMIRIFMACSLLALTGCANETEERERSTIEAVQIDEVQAVGKPFALAVQLPETNDGSTIEVVAMRGSLSACDFEWSLEQAAGTVLAPIACQEPARVRWVTIAFKDALYTIQEDNPQAGPEGMLWVLSNSDAGEAILEARFDHLAPGDSVRLPGQAIDTSLNVIEADPAVCDITAPFSLSTTAGGQVVLAVNAPVNGFPEGAYLETDQINVALDLPAIVFGEENMTFTMDFSTAELGSYTYPGGFRIVAGSSRCTLADLTIEIVADDSVAEDPTPIDEEFCQSEERHEWNHISSTLGISLPLLGMVNAGFDLYVESFNELTEELADLDLQYSSQTSAVRICNVYPGLAAGVLETYNNAVFDVKIISTVAGTHVELRHEADPTPSPVLSGNMQGVLVISGFSEGIAVVDDQLVWPAGLTLQAPAVNY